MIITVAINKGGNGKTTTAINLGAAFRELHKKVLLVDLDSQCNLTTTFGIPGDLDKSAGNMMLDQYSPQEVIQHKAGLDIIPSSFDLVRKEPQILGEPSADALLRSLLKPIKDQYDYIIIDTPPSMSIMTLNALTAADGYIVPMIAATYSYQSMNILLGMVDKIKRRSNENLQLLGVLFTQHSHHSRTALGKSIVEATTSQVKTFATHIRTSKALDEAVNAKQDIYQYDPASAGAVDYLKLAKEIMGA